MSCAAVFAAACCVAPIDPFPGLGMTAMNECGAGWGLAQRRAGPPACTRVPSTQAYAHSGDAQGTAALRRGQVAGRCCNGHSVSVQRSSASYPVIRSPGATHKSGSFELSGCPASEVSGWWRPAGGRRAPAAKVSARHKGRDVLKGVRLRSVGQPCAGPSAGRRKRPSRQPTAPAARRMPGPGARPHPGVRGPPWYMGSPEPWSLRTGCSSRHRQHQVQNPMTQTSGNQRKTTLPPPAGCSRRTWQPWRRASPSCSPAACPWVQ